MLQPSAFALQRGRFANEIHAAAL